MLAILPILHLYENTAGILSHLSTKSLFNSSQHKTDACTTPLDTRVQADGEPVIASLKTCVLAFSSFPWTTLHQSANEHTTEDSAKRHTKVKIYLISSFSFYHKSPYTVIEGN